MLKRFFHGGNTGSNPVGDANIINAVTVSPRNHLPLFSR